MYTLTLTPAERSAIDWIGYRYNHGDQLYRILQRLCDSFPVEASWDDPRDITYRIPEHAAWEIKSLCEPDDYAMDCFGPDLRSKLIDFCSNIV